MPRTPALRSDAPPAAAIGPTTSMLTRAAEPSPMEVAMLQSPPT